jgi:uncharacterized protein
MKLFVRLPAAAVALCLTAPAMSQNLPTHKLTAGIHVITAELAADDASRTRGLMHRKELAPNHGMLFMFGTAATRCMWMRNTLIPLSVAFVAEDGTIVNIADMTPHDETSHCSTRPVPFALEMTRGWFAERGIKPGMKIGRLQDIGVAQK